MIWKVLCHLEQYGLSCGAMVMTIVMMRGVHALWCSRISIFGLGLGLVDRDANMIPMITDLFSSKSGCNSNTEGRSPLE